MITASLANSIVASFMSLPHLMPQFMTALFAAQDLGNFFSTGTNNVGGQLGPIIKFAGIVVAGVGVILFLAHVHSEPRERMEYLKRLIWCLIAGGAAYALGWKLTTGLSNGVGNTVHSVFGI